MNQIVVIQNSNDLGSLSLKAKVLEEFLNQFTSKHTKKAYKSDLEDFFAFCELRNINILNILPAHVTNFMHKKSVSNSSKNRTLAALKSFFNWMEVNDFTTRNPLKAVRTLKASVESETLAFTDKESVQMVNTPKVNTIRGNYHRLVMVLLFNLGLRRSEVVSIRLCDIVEDRNYTILTIKGKGGKVRRIPLNNFVKIEISKYLERREILTKTILSKQDFLLQKGSIICDKSIDPSTVYRSVKKYAKILEVDRRVSPHSCRATAISHLLEKKESIRNVADFAGHSSTMTTQLYDKKRDGYANSAAFEVDYEGREPN